MLSILRLLLRWKWVDILLTRAEAYRALLDQFGFGWIPVAVFNAGLGVAMTAWAWIGDVSPPIAVTCGFAIATLGYMAVMVLRFGTPLAATGRQEPTKSSESAQIHSLIERLDKLDRNIALNNRKIADMQMFVRASQYTQCERLVYGMMVEVLSKFPKLDRYTDVSDKDMKWLKEQCELADNFVELFRDRLSETEPGSRARSLVLEAEREADAQVRGVPIETRPANIDPYELRRYVISTHKANRLKALLEEFITEKEEKSNFYLSKLRETQILNDY